MLFPRATSITNQCFFNEKTRPFARSVEMKTRSAVFSIAVLLGLFITGIAAAQTLHVTYVCNGERIFIENCNIRDLSDTATCMVGHPDTVLSNGLMKYTYETRGALKKLFPTCKQPSADEIARAKARDKKQNDLYEANVKKANEENDAIEARAQAVITGKKPQTPEERAMNRCITSGRLPASCTGNAMLGAFTEMLTSVLPADANGPASSGNLAGPKMAGVFQGAGTWRLDFLDQGVLVNCSVLAPDQHFYKLEFKTGHPTITIDTTPKPLVSRDPRLTDQNLSLHPNTLTGTETTYSKTSTYVPGTSAAPHASFSPKRVTCPALNLSSKGA